MTRRFQRARKPEEKELRRRAILTAARRLLREVGPLELSLNELARRSKVSKPNIYRYFESREEVLLRVWIEALGELTARLEASLARVRVGDAARVAAAIVAAFAEQPLMCELTALRASVLGRNVSLDVVVAVERALRALATQVGALVHGRLPALAREDCAWLVATTAIFVAGSWHAANPNEVAAAAHARPELAPSQPRFARDLSRFLDVTLAGLLRATPPRSRARAARG